MMNMIKFMIVLFTFATLPVKAAEMAKVADMPVTKNGSLVQVQNIKDPLANLPEIAPGVAVKSASESMSSVGTSTGTKRGVWVKNFTKKTLTMIAHRPGMEDLDLGMLVAGQEVFLPNAKGTVVSLTFKGGWFFTRDLQQRFNEGTVVEEHSLAVRD